MKAIDSYEDRLKMVDTHNDVLKRIDVAIKKKNSIEACWLCYSITEREKLRAKKKNMEGKQDVLRKVQYKERGWGQVLRWVREQAGRGADRGGNSGDTTRQPNPSYQQQS